MEGQAVGLFLDNAPARRDSEAMQAFRQHNVRVFRFSPHLTHALQPVGVGWAKQFKAEKDRRVASLRRERLSRRGSLLGTIREPVPRIAEINAIEFG
jgi:hypothetical protein